MDDYPELVARVVALVREGRSDGEIARLLTAEGFTSARTAGVPPSLVTRLRRQAREPSVTTRFRSHEKVDGQWTVWGLARFLGVQRDWLYRHIYKGCLSAERHPATGHYLIKDDPALISG